MAMSKPAIEGGTPVRDRVLPYSTQWIEQCDIDAVVDTLQSDWLTTGPKVRVFEKDFAEYTGAAATAAVNSCTSALNVSVVASGIGPGDEVITTPLTFIATTAAIIHAGATPVFADIRPDTYNIDPAAVEAAITPRTRAIIPVHYAGNPVDIDPIMEIARRHGLIIIEDGAHAAGAEYKGKKIGAFDVTTCFSFHPIKNMTTAEGGVITTHDTAFADRIRSLAYFGIPNDPYKRASSPRPWHYDVEALGYKYNMNEISAALGISQLKRLDHFTALRTAIAARYDEAFSTLDAIATPVVTADAKSAWHLYVIRLREGALRVDRDHILAALRAENIFANLHYTPVYRHPYCVEALGKNPADYPVCDATGASIITVPLFPKMTAADTQSVIDAVTKLAEWYAA